MLLLLLSSFAFAAERGYKNKRGVVATASLFEFNEAVVSANNKQRWWLSSATTKNSNNKKTNNFFYPESHGWDKILIEKNKIKLK